MTTEQDKDNGFATNFGTYADELVEELHNMPPPPEPEQKSQNDLLSRLLATEEKAKENAQKPVIFSPPLISRNDVGIIGRNTINVIQGHYGSHKSRMAELYAALMLAVDTQHTHAGFLDFKRQLLETFWVCYIDTERNLTQEFPYALQQIKSKAGHSIDYTPHNFRFTSVKDVPREDRLKAIKAFLTHIRSLTEAHLFVVLDVVTDCVGSFNDDEQAMKLFDFIGNLCDSQNATFLLVIHQNPGTEKARGHTGTEAANKAATVMQIGYEQTAAGQDTDLIRLRFLKLRHGKRPEPIYLQYNDEVKGLLLADAETVAQHVNHRKHKADADDIAERLESLLSVGPLQKGEVWTILESEFKTKNTTIRNRIKEIMEQQPLMYNEQGCAVRLDQYKEGRNEYYHLVPAE